MLAIEITLSVLRLVGLILLSFAAGFILRSEQLKSYGRKVLELEKEMLSNHADILDLQKEKANLVKSIRESKIPVIPMNSSKGDNDQSMKVR